MKFAVVIAGFDPGAKSAVALLDIDGRVLLLESFSGGIKEAVELIRSKGKPVIVAGDKRKLEAVEKLAAAFSAKPFFPDHDLSYEEKLRLTRGYRFRNDHEMDALAAALYAYRHYRKLIEKIKKREREIFELIIKNRAPNIAEAVKGGEKKADARGKKRKVELSSRVRDLERKINMLNDLLAIKEEELREAREELERMRDARMKELMRDKKIRRLESIIERLKSEKSARIRLEKELMEAHSRIARIEAELEAMKKARPERKEDIKERILRMIREYKERFK